MVHDVDAWRSEFVGRRVVAHVAEAWALVWCHAVLGADAGLAGDHAAQKDVLLASGVGGTVSGADRVGSIASKVDPLTVERRILAAEAPVSFWMRSTLKMVSFAPLWKLWLTPGTSVLRKAAVTTWYSDEEATSRTRCVGRGAVGASPPPAHVSGGSRDVRR